MKLLDIFGLNEGKKKKKKKLKEDAEVDIGTEQDSTPELLQNLKLMYHGNGRFDIKKESAKTKHKEKK